MELDHLPSTTVSTALVCAIATATLLNVLSRYRRWNAKRSASSLVPLQPAMPLQPSSPGLVAMPLTCRSFDEHEMPAFEEPSRLPPWLGCLSPILHCMQPPQQPPLPAPALSRSQCKEPPRKQQCKQQQQQQQQQQQRGKLMLPAVSTPICRVALETYPDHMLAFPLLRITARSSGAYRDNDDIPRCLHLCGVALSLGEPLLTLYDFGEARMPPYALGKKLVQVSQRTSSAHLAHGLYFLSVSLSLTHSLSRSPAVRALAQICVRWADEHAEQWDTHVQGLCIIIGNPFVRGTLNLLTKMLQPPQPIRYCATAEEALDFLSSVRVVKSYVKDSYVKHAT